MWWAGPLWWDMQCITGLFLSRSVLHVIWSGWSPYQFLVEGNMSWKPPRMELDFLNNTLLLMWRLFVSNLSIMFFICRIFCMYDSWVSWEHLVLSDQYVFAFSCFSKTLLLTSSGKKLCLCQGNFVSSRHFENSVSTGSTTWQLPSVVSHKSCFLQEFDMLLIENMWYFWTEADKPDHGVRVKMSSCNLLKPNCSLSILVQCNPSGVKVGLWLL